MEERLWELMEKGGSVAEVSRMLNDFYLLRKVNQKKAVAYRAGEEGQDVCGVQELVGAVPEV